MIVDCHVHLVPAALAAGDGARAWQPRLSRRGPVQVAEVAGRSAQVGPLDITSLDEAREVASRRGFDALVVAPWIQLAGDQFDSPGDAIEASRAQNDELARAVGPAVAALGTVPLRQPQAAVRELERALGLGLRGVEVGASVGGSFLGDDAFEPFWAAAERMLAVVFVHPTASGIPASAMGDYFLWNLLGNPLETAITAAHMTLAGVLDRHPGLNVLLAHGGGALPALRGRVAKGWSFQPQARSRLQRSPAEAVRKFHFDTVVYDASVLADLAGFVGADRLVVGTDHPFQMAEDDPCSLVRSAGLDAEALGANAAALFGLG